MLVFEFEGVVPLGVGVGLLLLTGVGLLLVTGVGLLLLTGVGLLLLTGVDLLLLTGVVGLLILVEGVARGEFCWGLIFEAGAGRFILLGEAAGRLALGEAAGRFVRAGAGAWWLLVLGRAES